MSPPGRTRKSQAPVAATYTQVPGVPKSTSLTRVCPGVEDGSKQKANHTPNPTGRAGVYARCPMADQGSRAILHHGGKDRAAGTRLEKGGGSSQWSQRTARRRSPALGGTARRGQRLFEGGVPRAATSRREPVTSATGRSWVLL